VARPCSRELQEQAEVEYLHKFATKSTDCPESERRYPQDSDEFRTEFDRDYTRIIHSRAFRRLRHKTQVFVSPQNDHICTRLEHSLHVASVARTISKALGLNGKLVAAIAVGHDLGHAPFGHKGEKNLHKLAQDDGLAFAHELHSLRVVDCLESPYGNERPGLNLTFAVRDGIACHSGETFEEELKPDRDRKPEDLDKLTEIGALPATLEGCVVRMADKVAYLGRDFEDAVATGLVERDDIPKDVRERLGDSNGAIIASLVRDIVEKSQDRKAIRVSPEVCAAMKTFSKFSDEHIYKHKKVVSYFKQIDRAMEFMYHELSDLIERAGSQRNGNLFPDRDEKCIKELERFLLKDVADWRNVAPAQLAIDFIAGMTDPYIVNSFQELFLPRSTV